MPFNHLNTSFDNLFDPYVSGTKTCPAGEYTLAGQDIRDRYAPLSVGSKRANVGYRINGTDITNYFAAKGTAVYWPLAFWDNKTYSHGSSAPNTARVAMNVGATGQVSFLEGGVVVESGNPLPADVDRQDVEVRCSQLSGDVAISNSWRSGSEFIWLPLAEIGITGAVQFQRSVFGTATGVFRLEFRDKNNPTKGTSGDFTFFLNVGSQS